LIARRPFDGNDTDNNSLNFVRIPITTASSQWPPAISSPSARGVRDRPCARDELATSTRQVRRQLIRDSRL
jgi:hypothetical protein